MPRSDIAVQQEAKYPEEAARRIDKDDRKQQSQQDRKQSKQSDKIAELHNKFTHTDYSEATGMTPEQRLAAISKDVNAIVHERVEREKEKEKAESAEWWAQEKAGEHAVGAEPKQSAEPIRAKNEAKPGQDKEGSNPVDNASDIKAPAAPKQDVSVAKGIRQAAPREEREEVGHRSVESDNSELSDHILSVSETSKDHKLRLPSFRARGSKLDEPSRSEIPDSLRSTEAVTPADGVNHYLQQKGTNHRSSWKSKNMSAERAALDATLAERREYLAAVGPASDDIGNHESPSDAGRPEFKLTSSVPHGSVKRDEQRSSSAWNITAGVTENDDPTRTHTRPGQDRKQELGKTSERDAQPWKATQQALKEDGHSGSFFQSRAGRTGSSSVPSQTETIVVERPAVSVTRTEPVARPGVVADIKHAVVEAKDSVVHAAQVTKHKIADAGHAVKETVKEKIEIAKDKAEDALEVVEDKLIAVKDKAGDAVEVVEEKIVAAKDRVEDAAESGWEATKDAVVSVKTKIVRTERDLEDKAERGWDATKSKAGELKRDTERGWENTKLRAESGWENAKDRMEAGWDSAKDRAEVTKLKTERVIVDSKDEFTTKLRGARRDVRDNIGVMEREIELRDAQLRREADRTGREIKLKADEAKLRVEHGWDRTKERADDLTHDAKIKAGEMKRSAEREVHSLKATAEGALHRTEEDVKSLGNKVREGLHWLNPLSHIGNKEKEVDVDSSPAGVHIRSHATTAERLPRHATPGTFTAPASLARPIEEEGVYVPNSLRGLEDSEPLPKSQGLSLRVPSLSSRRAMDREETLPQEAVQPLQHPNSLQGDIIEPVSLPPRATQQTKRGWLASLFGGRDSPREEAPADLTRQDKLNASARDFWDLKAQEGHPTTPSSPIGARSASPVGRRSMTPVAYSPSPSSPVMRSPMASERSGSSRLGAGMHEWGVMSDPLFEELLPQIME